VRGRGGDGDKRKKRPSVLFFRGEARACILLEREVCFILSETTAAYAKHLISTLHLIILATCLTFTKTYALFNEIVL